MPSFRLPRRRPHFAALLALFAFVAALIAAAQVHHNWSSYGAPADFGTIFGVKLVEWSLWAMLVPAIVWLDRHHGFQRHAWPAAVALHLAGAVIWFLAMNAVMTVLTFMTDPGVADATFASLYTDRLIFKLPAALGVYGFVLAAQGVLHLLSARYAQSVREAQLQTELAGARLRNLQMQLQPHFLFNALHSIGGLVREGDGERAVDMIAELSELLRRALGTVEHQEVTLDEELDFLDHYVRIQQVRFSERLQVRYAIDPAARSVLIPSLLLQPLVENAVRHAVERTGRAVEITIGAQLENGRVLLEVSDTGPGLAAPVVEGVGLGTTRQRLTHLYGSAQSFAIGPLPEGGTAVRVMLPHRT